MAYLGGRLRAHAGVRRLGGRARLPSLHRPASLERPHAARARLAVAQGLAGLPDALENLEVAVAGLEASDGWEAGVAAGVESRMIWRE